MARPEGVKAGFMIVDLSGRTAVVTGAGTGLGRAHALELARRGARLVVNDIGGALDGSGTSATSAESVVEEITAAGGEAVADVHDVVGGGPAIVELALDHFGSVDILVNNAGFLRDSAFHKMDLEAFDAVLDVHLRASAALTMTAFRRMREQGYGRIVLTTSTTGLLGNFGQANYGAAKAGLVGLMKVLAIEGAGKGVKTNCIAPLARTRMTEPTMSEAMRAVLDPELVAAAVAYLSSEGCGFNGEVLSAGGGRVARFFVGLTPGWGSSTLTAEEIAEHVDEIRDEVGYLVLANVHEEFEFLESRLPFPARGHALGPVASDLV
jgi:NAD(P)-dependent dehydrogenase (short-subunit alcohol dehydrogenase family)